MNKKKGIRKKRKKYINKERKFQLKKKLIRIHKKN